MTRLPLRARPAKSEVDWDPAEDEFVYYEEPPIVISQVEPVRPEVPRTANIRYEVLLKVLVGKDGLVRDVKVIRGVDGLNEAAVDAVKKWTFKPARSNNKPVSVWIEIPIRFQL
jgi:TonB family C-terminal domain